MDRFLKCGKCGNTDQGTFESGLDFVVKCPCGHVNGVGVLDTRTPNERIPKSDKPGEASK